MNIDLDAIPSACEIRIGMPRPDWTAIWNWVHQHVPAGEHDEAWQSLALQWLDKLRRSLPIEYAIEESPQFQLLSGGNRTTNDRLLHWCEQYRQSILNLLKGVATDEGCGKLILLAFHNRETFFDYILDFYPEVGEYASAGGTFLDYGYAHIATCLQFEPYLDRTIAHELTHALLRHLPLPRWLDEGVTQVVEDLAVGSSYFHIDHELVRRHRAYWNEFTIDAFWSGESFHFSDDGQELSYSLAQVLVRNLMADFPKRILDFLNEANLADAGNNVLVSTCGMSLAQRVEQFLGGGPWTPRSDYWQR